MADKVEKTSLTNFILGDAEVKSTKISSLSDRPNAASEYGGEALSAKELKERFDALPEAIRGKFNELLGFMQEEDFAGEIKINLCDTISTLADLVEAIKTGELAKNLYVTDEQNGKKSLTAIYQNLTEDVERLATYKADETDVEAKLGGKADKTDVEAKLADAKKYTDEQIAALWDDDKLAEAYVTLQNVTTYLEDHEADTVNIIADINELKEVHEETAEEIESLKSSVDALIDLYEAPDDTKTDEYFAALLDDTNTTTTFKAWYNIVKGSEGEEVSRYTLLERFFRMLALNNEQTHTVRFYSSDTSTDSRGTPWHSLAFKKAQVLATDTGVVENANSWLDEAGNDRKDGEDWATENRITWYVRANALSLEDGTMNVLAIEGVDDNFDITGNLAPVYTFQLSPWYKEWTDENGYEYKSWRANENEGYAPFNNNVDLNGNPRILTWHPSFGSVMTDDGQKLTSGAYRSPKDYTSPLQGLNLARAWNDYEAVGADANAKWALSEWQHRHFNKENSRIAQGRLSRTRRGEFFIAHGEGNTNRILLQDFAKDYLLVGLEVTVSSDSGAVVEDTKAKINRIEEVAVDNRKYTAVYLNLEGRFNTVGGNRAIVLSEETTGETEYIQGYHNDGSPGSLTSGKWPLRVAGMEVLIGYYFTGLDVLYEVSLTSGKEIKYDVYQCLNSTGYSDKPTDDYQKVGESVLYDKSGWGYVKDFKRTDAPVLIPIVDRDNGSYSSYYKSAFYVSGGTGLRAPTRFGDYTVTTGIGGLACARGCDGPKEERWSSVPWLAGAEKIRGK